MLRQLTLLKLHLAGLRPDEQLPRISQCLEPSSVPRTETSADG